MSKGEFFSQLGRNTALYTLAGLITRGVSFLLLPVYTRFLTTADYGVMQLLDITVDIAAILFVAGMTAGMQRYYFAAKSDAERNAVVSTTFALEFGLGALAAAALFATAPLASLIGLTEPGHVFLVRIAACNFLLGVLSSVPLLLLQSQKRAGAFLAATLAKLAMQVTLNLVFLVWFQMGVLGILYAGFIANLVMGAVLCVWLVRSVGFHVHTEVLRQLRAFGVPYQISTAGSFILVFGDRFFLGASRTIGEVGLYGLAYQFGFLLSSLVEGPFIRAWNPMRFQQLELSRAERDSAYNHGLSILAVTLVFTATAIVLFTPPVIQFVTTPEFHPAAKLVPIIVAAYVTQSYTQVVAFGIDVSARTKWYTYATWTSVVVILVLYTVLIPRFGGFGAAWATLAAFLVRFGMTYRFAHAVWPISYRWGRVLRATGVGIGCEVARVMISPSGVGAGLAWGVALLIACALGLWSVALDSDERAQLVEFARRSAMRLSVSRAGTS